MKDPYHPSRTEKDRFLKILLTACPRCKTLGGDWVGRVGKRGDYFKALWLPKVRLCQFLNYISTNQVRSERDTSWVGVGGD